MYDLYPQNWNDEGSRLATARVEADRKPRRRAKIVPAAAPTETLTAAPTSETSAAQSTERG